MTAAAQGDAPARFAEALDVLVQQLWTWSPSRFTPPRVAALHLLLDQWAALAPERGGSHVPLVPRLEHHALADQLAVLGAEIVRVPRNAERAATQALEHLVAARTALA